MTEQIFNGKVALVTGAGSGIGAATAMMLAARGASVVAADISAQAADRTVRAVQERQGTALTVLCDVTSSANCDSAVAAALANYGRLDILVNNAGAGRPGASHELADADWRSVMKLNLDGNFFMARAALRPMLSQQSGAIVNVSSMFGLVGFAQHAGYSAAKAGIANLTRTLGLEYAQCGIRVNAVCPGVIRTGLVAGHSEERLQWLASLHPMGRLGEPEEVARCICFLASDEASYVTGACLSVDGGYTAG
jgi:Dehydrogenases with different specificities (related to short-chain alcohol dehydrogenases)